MRAADWAQPPPQLPPPEDPDLELDLEQVEQYHHRLWVARPPPAGTGPVTVGANPVMA